MTSHNHNKGFSYIEALLSLALISLTVVPVTMAFFHISRTQVLSYYIYQKAILLDSVMIESVVYLAHSSPRFFSQDQLDHLIQNSPTNFRLDMFEYQLIDFYLSADLPVTVDMPEGANPLAMAYKEMPASFYFFIKIEIRSQFGTAQVFRYALFS